MHLLQDNGAEIMDWNVEYIERKITNNNHTEYRNKIIFHTTCNLTPNMLY